MKLLKLSIEGINSFTRKQSINFATLSEKKVYGIFGQTGSGKSTVLDCIFLALYGKIIRTKKPIEFINVNRSDASVVLEFSVTGTKERNSYIVERTFKVNRQSGDVQAGARLVQIFSDGSSQSLAKTVDAVNEHIEKIVGFGAEEFKRCIALPQGEYAKLLQDSSYDKIQIFSKVFGLGKFGQQMFDRLSKKEDECEKKLFFMMVRLRKLAEMMPHSLTKISKN